jgi:hypothetical protein
LETSSLQATLRSLDLQTASSILTKNSSLNTFFNLGDLGLREGWSKNITNPSFCYEDVPFIGWRKDVSIQTHGKDVGNLKPSYYFKKKNKKFFKVSELARFLSDERLPRAVLSRYDFRPVFCLCRQPDERNGTNFIQCEFGKAGCNGWIHPFCVGLGDKTQQELESLPRFICPLCEAYLVSINKAHIIERNKWE